MFNSSLKNVWLSRDRSNGIVSLRGDLPYWLTGLLVRLTGALLAIGGTYCLLTLILLIINPQSDFFLLDFNLLFGYLIPPQVIGKNSQESIFIIAIALLWIGEIITNYLIRIISIKYYQYLIKELKHQGLKLLCQASLSFFAAHPVEEILFKINRELERVAITWKNRQILILATINLIILSGVLIFVSISLTLVTTAFLGLTVISDKVIFKKLKHRSGIIAEKNQLYHRQIVEFILGINPIKQSSIEQQKYQQITQSIKDKQESELASQAISALGYSISKIILVILVLALILTSYYTGDRQFSSSSGILFAYILLLLRLLPLIGQINQARAQINKHQSSIEVFNNFLDRLQKSQIVAGKAILNQLSTGIEFQDVTFAYPHHGQIILDGINFKLLSQETMAIVGASGAGKSSLVNLLPRLYEPIAGRITINNRQLQDYDLQSLRQNIAVIDHNTFIFNNSLLYNLTYGIPKVSEAEVMAAAKMTKLDRSIAQLPQGLLTSISDLADPSPESWRVATAGKLHKEIFFNLQQKQLLAITRAILLQPQIVILDEVTKDLEPTACKLVEAAIAQLCRNRTTIIVTNRLETIKQADRIIILNKGKIVESGNHQSLLKTGNLYKRLYAAQFKTSQQSRQQQLAKRISQKLSRQTNHNLSSEIRQNLNTLLNYLQQINEGLVDDEAEQTKILDESYQSAKNMLASLREYKRKITRGLKPQDD